MTDGPQQPYNPQQGRTTPSFQQAPDQDPWGARAPAPPSGNAPDWSALADDREAASRRRRKLFMIGGGALAAAAVAGIVAAAVVVSGDESRQPGGPGPSESQSRPLPPEPTFSDVAPPPPPDPLDFISSAEKDTAPLSADSLFPTKQFVWGGRSYSRTASTADTNCTTAAKGRLSTLLGSNACRRIIRATYAKDGFAVTVGVAVFDDTATAAKLKPQESSLRPLAGGGVPEFCVNTVCKMTSNAVGRYAYFTITGFTDNRRLTQADTAAKQAGTDASNYAFNRIVQRGKDQADASVAGSG